MHPDADHPATYVPVTVALVHEEMSQGVAAWRVAQPFYELATRGASVAWTIAGTERAAQYIHWSEVILLLRSEWGVGNEALAHSFIDKLHTEGRCVIYDTDDDLYSPSSVARVRATGDEELNARSDAQLEEERLSRIFAVGLADGVTVSTEHLASVVRQYTDKPVVVVPNAIDLPRFRAAVGDPPQDWPLTIGWAGGNRPDVDAEQLAIAWSRVADRYPHVRFLVGGYPLNTLVKSVPEDRLTVVPKQSISVYPQMFRYIDIGCAPLNDEPFNRSKSPIKVMEYAAAGCAVVASPLYGEDHMGFVNNGFDGFIAHSSDSWDQALSVLIENEEWRKDMASRLSAKVERDHVLQDQVYRWPEAWRTIIADYRSRPTGVEVGGRST